LLSMSVIEEGPLARPSLAEIERALDEVVSALVAYRLSPPEGVRRALSAKPRDFEVIGISALCDTDSAVLKARDVASSPVEIGLKHSLRQLGKLLHAEVGDDQMIEVAERICDLDSNNWGRRMSPINSAWSGIGSWYA
jgi:hypothetical protein